MPSLLQRMRTTSEREARRSFDPLTVINPFYGGQMHPVPIAASTMDGVRAPAIEHNFLGYVEQIHKQHGPVAAAVWVRQLMVSQLRFLWRKTHGEKKGSTEWRESLEILHRPRTVTRPSLLATVEHDASYAGNAFVRRLPRGEGLARLRPDWVDLVLYSDEAAEPMDIWLAGDVALVGYLYWPGGRRGTATQALPLHPDEVWHFAPEPDGTGVGRGMSWVTSVIREVAADSQASDYLQKFFENAATANMVVKTPPEVQEPKQFEEWVDAFELGHVGTENAWRNVYLTAGSDVEVVGSKLTDLGLRDFQGGLENRIAVRSRIPAAMLGIREGLQGSSLNQGNFDAAKRQLTDGFVAPYAEMLCASAERILTDRKPDEELHYDEDSVTFLRADVQAQSALVQSRASAIETLYRAGYDPDAIVEAVDTQDLGKLKGSHTGAPSVQANAEPVQVGGSKPAQPEQPQTRMVTLGPEDRDLIRYNPHQARDAKGRWSSGGAGVAGLPKAARDQISAGRGGSAQDPVEVEYADEALVLMDAGYHVRLPEREVGTLVDRLGAMAQDAKAKGEDAPNYDLCKVSVPRKNLFCAQSLGISRAEMPQLKGYARPGTEAAAMAGGSTDVEVDSTSLYLDRLQARGIGVQLTSEDAAYLKATQSELVGAKVGGMMRAMEAGTMPKEVMDAPIIVSSDNYVVDGHHRWAAKVGMELHLGEQVNMAVYKVDMPITELLPDSIAFTEEIGIATKAANTAARSDAEPCQHCGPPEHLVRQAAAILAANLPGWEGPADDPFS